MSTYATIRLQRGKHLYINSLGQIWSARTSHRAPSQDWRILHATEHAQNPQVIVRHYALEQILKAPEAIKWRWKNGNQRTKLKTVGPEIPEPYSVRAELIKEY